MATFATCINDIIDMGDISTFGTLLEDGSVRTNKNRESDYHLLHTTIHIYKCLMRDLYVHYCTVNAQKYV